jgi:hypothetical protein
MGGSGLVPVMSVVSRLAPVSLGRRAPNHPGHAIRQFYLDRQLQH